jgi:hypothetical protein
MNREGAKDAKKIVLLMFSMIRRANPRGSGSVGFEAA